MTHEPGVIEAANTADALQGAIDVAVPGSIILLPPGDLVIETTIRLRSNLTLQGAADGTSRVVLAPGSNCHAFTNDDWAAGVDGVVVRDVTVDGNGDDQHRPDEHQGVTFACAFYLKNARNTLIERVRTDNIRQTGIHFSGGRSAYVREFRCARAGWSGVSSSGADDLRIERALIANAGLDVQHSGIHLDGGAGVVVVDAHVSHCTGNAIMLDSTFEEMSHCLVDAACTNSRRGVSLAGSGEYPLRNIMVTGTMSHNEHAGILVSNATDVIVDRAVVDGNTEFGILLQGRVGAQRCLLTRTVLRGNGVGLAELHESTDNAVCDLSFEGNAVDVQLAQRSGLRNQLAIGQGFGSART